MAELRLRTKRIEHIIEGEKEYEEVIPMRCVTCSYEEDAEADIVFECLEFGDLPIPVLTCPECGHDTLIPVQVIEETEEAEKKESSPR